MSVFQFCNPTDPNVSDGECLRIRNENRLVGVSILSITGILVGLISFLFGLIGGGLSIVFGGLWVLFGLRLLKFQNSARRVIVILATLFFLSYAFIIYIAETADYYLSISVILQIPLAFLNLISLVYLLLPQVKKRFI